jgi:hypothetical protein
VVEAVVFLVLDLVLVRAGLVVAELEQQAILAQLLVQQVLAVVEVVEVIVALVALVVTAAQA